MDDCTEAGDLSCCQGNEQIESMAGELEKMDQIYAQDSDETIDKLMPPGAFVEEGAHSASSSIDCENILEPPIFDLDCHCGTLHSNVKAEIENASDVLTVRDEKETSPSECFACGNVKPFLESLSNENVGMEYESSISASQNKEEDYYKKLECHHNLLLDEENHLLENNRSLEHEEGVNNQGEITDKDIATNDTQNAHLYVGGLRLDELDDDSIFYIASFLEARTIKYGLSLVCQRFQGMFQKEAFWKARLDKKWKKTYPAVPASTDISWANACIACDDCQRVWRKPEIHTHHFMYSCNVNGEVDAVHLMQNGKLLISGDRNRNLNVIDLSRYNNNADSDAPPSIAEMNDMLVQSNCTTHRGWIWSLASIDNNLLTGSWDTYIRRFDLNIGLQQCTKYKCRSAVLSIYAEEHEIVASCFDKKVYFFDQRSDSCRSQVFHKQAVMSVTGNQDYIISGSEDKTISVYDRRAGRVFKTFELEAYPLCLSFRDNQLWFGDKIGQIHLHDASRGMFSHVGTYDVGHTDKVTDMISATGAIFTCSGDKTMKILTPTNNPAEIVTLYAHNKELAKIDYNCGVLASAGGDEAIGVWIPKYWQKAKYLV